MLQQTVRQYYEDKEFSEHDAKDINIGVKTTVKVKVPNITGWNVENRAAPVRYVLSILFTHTGKIDLTVLIQVTTAAVVQYTGEGEPPHIDTMITAASENITPPDLTFEAELKGVQKPNKIKFEKEAQNVVECVCQVFYHKEAALNSWKAIIAFFPKQHLEVLL